MEEKIEDIFGIKPYGEILKTITEESIGAVKTFLETVCKPAAEEFGFLLSDKIRVWRLNNTVKILEKANNKLHFDGDKLQLKQIHPKIINKIFEEGSWESDDEVQNYWASLISSSASEYPNDDNIIYFEILKQLTKTELLLIQHFCKNSQLEENEFGILKTKLGIIMDSTEFFGIVNSSD